VTAGFVVIVTGWRDATTEDHGEIIERELFMVKMSHEQVTLRHGQCPYGGVDLIAENTVRPWGWQIERDPAQIRNGKILGPARNRRMCAKGASLCLGFPGPGSRGTWDCLKWAAHYGIPFRGIGLKPAAAANTPPTHLSLLRTA
jgi:hypothetical protein